MRVAGDLPGSRTDLTQTCSFANFDGQIPGCKNKAKLMDVVTGALPCGQHLHRDPAGCEDGYAVETTDDIPSESDVWVITVSVGDEKCSLIEVWRQHLLNNRGISRDDRATGPPAPTGLQEKVME
ncbi:hypothetical protein Bbelb_405920 [Branchiostoma belcheri]|nr:hypothetical protein Bbelb_405920 [Branchiostoma belcheri]